MGINASRGLFASAAALLLCVGVAGPATARQYADFTPAADASVEPEETEVNTAPPEEPEEELTDVVDAGPDVPEEPAPTGKPTPPADWPEAEYCGPSHGVYSPTSQGKKYHKGVGPTLSNYNGTSRTAKSTFTSEKTGEVGLSVTAGLKVEASVLIAKLEKKYDINLSFKITAKLGNKISVNTPSKRTTNAKYGVYRLKHTGKSYTVYSNCETSTKKTITSCTPYRVGWYLWEE